MKLLITSLLMLFVTLSLFAQEWQTDLTKAKELAQANKQKIILVFSGSDWCAPCIKMEKKIWSSTEFKSYAENEVVLLKADFPRKRKNKHSKEQQNKNNQLAEQYNKSGYFPYVVVLNENGKILGTTGYKKKLTPTQYMELLTSF